MVETANVAVVAPAATVRVAGTCASVELELRLTVTDEDAGACEIVTVPVLADPPTTVAGLRLTAVTVNGVSVSVVVIDELLNVAVRVTGVVLVTAAVATEKVAVVAPNGTVTVLGIDASVGLELVNLTTSPAGAATPPSVTVPVTVV